MAWYAKLAVAGLLLLMWGLNAALSDGKESGEVGRWLGLILITVAAVGWLAD